MTTTIRKYFTNDGKVATMDKADFAQELTFDENGVLTRSVRYQLKRAEEK